MRKRKSDSPRPPAVTALPVLRPNVAGIDIGSRQHFVAAPQREEGRANVRAFATTTSELNALADWLREQDVVSVALESTSIYWIPVYDLLESRGLEVLLVNARQLHNVPGRKTDMHDCQWIQVLHSCGLLRGSFRPGEQIARLRAIHRQLSNLVAEQTRAVQWMQKALDQMNVHVHHAVTDLTGQTGMAIVRAIVAGERRPSELAKLRDHRCQKSEAQIAEHLTGTWRAEHLFSRIFSGLRPPAPRSSPAMANQTLEGEEREHAESSSRTVAGFLAARCCAAGPPAVQHGRAGADPAPARGWCGRPDEGRRRAAARRRRGSARRASCPRVRRFRQTVTAGGVFVGRAALAAPQRLRWR